jgi:hypothetical protein
VPDKTHFLLFNITKLYHIAWYKKYKVHFYQFFCCCVQLENNKKREKITKKELRRRRNGEMGWKERK